VKLVVVAPSRPFALGGPMKFDVQLVNDTDDAHYLPVTRGSERGAGTRSAFFIEQVNGDDTAKAKPTGGERRFLLPDQVEWAAGQDPVPVLRPGQSLRVKIILTGEASPLRRPGAIRVRVGYESVAQRWPGMPFNIDRKVRAENVPLKLVSDPIEVHGMGRKPADLEKALRGKDMRARMLAVAELALREDDAVLPVLRRNAEDPSLRLAAIERLGAKAEERDFALVYQATRDPDKFVRAAAVRALANYPQRKARAKLVALSYDHELRGEAIRALRRHKHPATIDLYVRILRLRTADRVSIEIMCATIREWTGMPVTDRAAEIRAFERWWAKNRRAWTQRLTQR
jgi:hypothetical protein